MLRDPVVAVTAHARVQKHVVVENGEGELGRVPSWRHHVVHREYGHDWQVPTSKPRRRHSDLRTGGYFPVKLFARAPLHGIGVANKPRRQIDCHVTCFVGGEGCAVQGRSVVRVQFKVERELVRMRSRLAIDRPVGIGDPCVSVAKPKLAGVELIVKLEVLVVPAIAPPPLISVWLTNRPSAAAGSILTFKPYSSRAPLTGAPSERVQTIGELELHDQPSSERPSTPTGSVSVIVAPAVASLDPTL